MQNAARAITRIRKVLNIFLPKSWVSTPVAHDEGVYPRRPSGAEMEIEPGDPASSWVAWETSARHPQRRRRCEGKDPQPR
jgi:hypothetical protein